MLEDFGTVDRMRAEIVRRLLEGEDAGDVPLQQVRFVRDFRQGVSEMRDTLDALEER